jgi:hypothetical protein
VNTFFETTMLSLDSIVYPFKFFGDEKVKRYVEKRRSKNALHQQIILSVGGGTDGSNFTLFYKKLVALLWL